MQSSLQNKVQCKINQHYTNLFIFLHDNDCETIYMMFMLIYCSLTPWWRQHCWTRVLILGDLIRLDEISGTFVEPTISCSIFGRFFFPEKNVYLWPQHQGTFSSAWMLEFWPIDEFQGKFKTNWRVLKNRRNAFYRISLRNITAHVFLTAFVTSIFTFVHTLINLFVQSQYRNMLIINQWAAWNYSLIRVINTLSVGFYTARSQSKNT